MSNTILKNNFDHNQKKNEKKTKKNFNYTQKMPAKCVKWQTEGFF